MAKQNAQNIVRKRKPLEEEVLSAVANPPKKVPATLHFYDLENGEENSVEVQGVLAEEQRFFPDSRGGYCLLFCGNSQGRWQATPETIFVVRRIYSKKELKNTPIKRAVKSRTPIARLEGSRLCLGVCVAPRYSPETRNYTALKIALDNAQPAPENWYERQEETKPPY